MYVSRSLVSVVALAVFHLAEPVCGIIFTPLSLNSLSVSACTPTTTTVDDYTTEACFTRRASTKHHGSVHTTSYFTTLTSTRDAYTTVTPHSTITPSTKTVTHTMRSTITSTDDVPQATDTSTSTFTITTTATETASTVTSTYVDYTYTIVYPDLGPTTVPAPAGFMGVLDTLPGAAAKRDLHSPREATRAERSLHTEELCVHPKPPEYPQEVVCYVTVDEILHHTVTRTASTTVGVTGPTPTTTITSTSTVTTVKSITTPDASTTVYTTVLAIDTTQVTPTVYSPSYSTYTYSEPTYATTLYEICLTPARNIAGAINGNGLNAISAPLTDQLYGYTTDDTDQYGCCNSCAQNPTCAFTEFLPTFPAGLQCNILGAATGLSTCPVGQPGDVATAIYYSEGPYHYAPDQGAFFSNGYCGEINEAYDVDPPAPTP